MTPALTFGKRVHNACLALFLILPPPLPPEKLGGGVLPLFQTKICDFPYPISDLTKNLIPCFRPISDEFQLLHGWLNNLRRALLTVVLPNDEEEASSYFSEQT